MPDGTTLMAVMTVDGIVMAADDLVYAEKGGTVIPSENGVQKVFVLGNNILIGSAALMRHAGIKYKFEDWISEFIRVHQSSDGVNLPSETASDLERKMRHTLKAIESMPEDRI